MSKRAIPFSIIPDWSRQFCPIANICGYRRSFIFMFWPGTFLQQGGNRRPQTLRITSRRCLKLFARERLQVSEEADHRAQEYISDMLIALTRATPEQAFLLRAHIGNYSLFITGIFHENTQRRSLRGGPDMKFYEQIGRTNSNWSRRM
jgi:hypothetical protein